LGVLWSGIGPILFTIILFLAGFYYGCRLVADAILPPSAAKLELATR
jgi:hypothetical protein